MFPAQACKYGRKRRKYRFYNKLCNKKMVDGGPFKRRIRHLYPMLHQRLQKRMFRGSSTPLAIFLSETDIVIKSFLYFCAKYLKTIRNVQIPDRRNRSEDSFIFG